MQFVAFVEKAKACLGNQAYWEYHTLKHFKALSVQRGKPLVRKERDVGLCPKRGDSQVLEA